MRVVLWGSRWLLVLLIAGVAPGWMYVGYNPRPVATGPARNPAWSGNLAPSPAQGGRAADNAAPASRSAEEDRRNLLLCLYMLRDGQQHLERVQDYSAVFARQELVNGEMREPQAMRVKIRHQPFSVYMCWLTGDEGRELIYIDGQNDGQLIVQPGGWRSRLVASLRLDPHGSLARSESRHPVTELGMKELCRRLIQIREADLQSGRKCRCSILEHELAAETRCTVFTIEFLNRGESPAYRKVQIYLDEQTRAPVMVRNFTWLDGQESIPATNLDELTLIETYSYSGVQWNSGMSDEAFDTANREYNFR